MPRYRLDIAYDGTDFSGWWRQPDQRTVASAFDEAFARLGEADAQPLAAARTDSGVHALGQVAHVDLARDWDEERLRHQLNTHLPEDAACLQVTATSQDWHAVHCSTGKTYSYHLDNSPVADPFLRHTAWRPAHLPSLQLLQDLSRGLIGQHDFKAFKRSGDHRENYVATISDCTWQQSGGTIIGRLTANRFIYRLARSLFGALIATANGAIAQDAISKALKGEPSKAPTFQAPAHGLHLEQVHY